MKPAAFLFAAVLAAPLQAAEPITAPADWRKETFEFPLRFAPSIPYEGTEHVRFAPEWGRFSTGHGFTYAILWDVKDKPVAVEDLEDYLEAYFTGLMKGVAPARKMEIPKTPTSAALHPMTPIAEWQQSYGAEIRTWNAFSKGEPLLLWGEITQRACGGGRMQVFLAFSQATRDQPAWSALRDVRKATTCDKSKN